MNTAPSPRKGCLISHTTCFAVLVLVLLHSGALAEAAATSTAAARAASSTASRIRDPGERSRREAGQFFGVNINFGGSTASLGPSARTSIFPGVLETIPTAIASVLGVQQHAEQQQQPTPAAAPAPKPQQQQIPKQKQQKITPKSNPGPSKQPLPPPPTKPGKKPQPQQPPVDKKQHKQQPPKQPLRKSTLIAQVQPAKQQQVEPRKIYYKKQHKPKSCQPVVASAPSYVPPPTPGFVPMCEWRADFNECQVHRHFYLAVKEPPQSYIAQTVTAASARDYACAANSDPSACQESSQGLRCGWNLSGGRAWDSSGCRSYYMAEWTVLSYLIRAGVGAAGAATGLSNLDAFSCPGSLAARALACNTAYPMDTHGNYEPNLCATAAPGCSFQQSSNNCVMSTDLTSQLAQLRPQDVGTCSAACYLRVLDSCRKTASTSDPDRCWANKGCTWANGACGPDLFSSQLDAWGRKVAAAAEACSREKEAWGCGQAGAKGLLPLPSASAQEALQRGLPGPGQQDAQCPI